MRLGNRAWSGARKICLLGCLTVTPFSAASELSPDALPTPHTREKFRSVMPRHIRSDHPAIAPVADAIRAVTTKPIEQIVMVHDVTHLLVDFDDDERVYGKYEYHATLEEMLENRRRNGWLYLRDDCDGRSVFAAHLLAALGISYKLQASYWKRHAWVVARVDGVDYDLLDLTGGEPETDRPSYRYVGRFVTRVSNPPPGFNWRRRWAENTRRNLQIGLRLGLLTHDSKPGKLRERYLTDWVKRSPGGDRSPHDERTLTAAFAAFPLGESLSAGVNHAIAAASEKATSPNGLAAAATSGNPAN